MFCNNNSFVGFPNDRYSMLDFFNNLNLLLSFCVRKNYKYYLHITHILTCQVSPCQISPGKRYRSEAGQIYLDRYHKLSLQ